MIKDPKQVNLFKVTILRLAHALAIRNDEYHERVKMHHYQQAKSSLLEGRSPELSPGFYRRHFAIDQDGDFQRYREWCLFRKIFQTKFGTPLIFSSDEVSILLDMIKQGYEGAHHALGVFYLPKIKTQVLGDYRRAEYEAKELMPSGLSAFEEAVKEYDTSAPEPSFDAFLKEKIRVKVEEFRAKKRR